MLCQPGDRGPLIGVVQAALGLTVTNYYDATLDSAVAAFQTANGLTVSGGVDLTTYYTLIPTAPPTVGEVETTGSFTNSSSAAKFPTTKAVADYVTAHGGGGGGGGIPASLATGADQSVYSTGASTWAAFSLTSIWRAFLGTVKAVWTEATGVLSVWGLQIDTAPTTTPTTAVGQMVWDDTEGTITLGAKGGNVVIPVGTGQLTRIQNDDSVSLTPGQVVYLSGSNGSNTLAKRAQANAESTSATAIGLVAETIGTSQHGWVMISGILRNINTAHLTLGQVVWLSATTPGETTPTEPAAPNHGVQIGLCVRVHASTGAILIAMQNGYELGELHNVRISSATTGDLLQYDGTLPAWKNVASIAQSQVTSLTTDLAGKVAKSGDSMTGPIAVTLTQTARTAHTVTNSSTAAAAEAGFSAITGAGTGFFGTGGSASSKVAGLMCYTADSIPWTVWTNGLRRLTVTGADGLLGVGVVGATSRVHVAAGTTLIAPLKLNSGTNLSTAESGAVEYDGTDWYLTNSTPRRRTVAYLATVTTSTSPVSVPAIGGHIRVTGTAGAKTVTLPATSGVKAGTLVTVKDASGNAASGTITVNAAASEFIDGGSSATITTNYGVLRLIYSGSTGRWETC